MAWRTRGHRGDALEELILFTNEYYRNNGFARVDKISTPVTVTELNDKKQIVMGYYEKKSTVDFVGIAQGHPLCFDAKETNLLNLPLNNIHPHQLDYMRDFSRHGGIAFLLLHFKRPDEYYFISYEQLLVFIEEAKKQGRKSIPLSAMENAIPVDFIQERYINYLAAINVYLQQQEAEKLKKKKP